MCRPPSIPANLEERTADWVRNGLHKKAQGPSINKL